MSIYRVTWEIDLQADTPLEAAQQALAIHRDPSSMATVFEVRDENGHSATVDLEEAEDDP